MKIKHISYIICLKCSWQNIYMMRMLLSIIGVYCLLMLDLGLLCTPIMTPP